MKVHFMGIGGSGASAAAGIANAHDYQVTGCDLDKNSQYLGELGDIPVSFEHDPSHLEGLDLLVLSPAIESKDTQNPEVASAQKSGLEIMTWQQFAGQELMKNKKVVAITGTHGKTTTTTMTALIAERAGLDPSVIIGAPVREWGRNFRVGKSNLFIIEADEYGENFLNYHADIAVITNIEMDHPEYYHDFAAFKQAFVKFVNGMKEKSLLLTTNEVALTNAKGQTVRLKADQFELKVLGDFNQLNATFAYEVAKHLGVDLELTKEVLRNFEGAGRRLEMVGDNHGIKVFDDYGHHPTEILKTTQALREKYPELPIWLVYQPHMFSRTKYLFDDFVTAFQKAPVDQIILTEIFPSRETDDYSVNSSQLVDSVARNHVRKIGKYADITSYLASQIKTDSIVLFMGAGDVYLASQLFLKTLNEHH